MAAYWLDWLELALRWFHVIIGIGWIGTSFFFMWLDASLEKPAGDAHAEVGGESWLVHSGGFYRMQKYRMVPEAVLRRLHWFKWEAYLTWISGALLLVVLYYLGAATYMVPAEGPLGPEAAVVLGIAVVALGWVVYDRLCGQPWARDQRLFAVVGLVLVGALAFGLSQVLTGRAAYIHVGAVLGTIMAANVAMVIIPAQRALVAATARGERPDPAMGARAKHRSVHNNYLTLPVVFIMVSNHYPMTYGHGWGWAVLLALIVLGGLVRHWANLQDEGRRALWLPPLATAGLLALAFVAQPRPTATADAAPVRFAEIEQVIHLRCVTCHADAPTYDGFDVAPSDVRLETAADIRRHATQIYQQTVLTDAMPIGNVTGISEAERALLGRWYRGGAAID